jgi:hypothetical protein
MAVSAVVGAIGAAGLYQQNEAQKQGRRQFNQQAAMETTRQQQEFHLGQENLAQQEQALALQQEAFNAQLAASERATEEAKKQATLADIASNRAMKRAPNIGAMLTGNDKAGASGASSTLLTGATGAATGMLGRASLLGA